MAKSSKPKCSAAQTAEEVFPPNPMLEPFTMEEFKQLVTLASTGQIIPQRIAWIEACGILWPHRISE